ncbi:MAG: hypothetical protein PHS92_01540 [Candidatus Gracilibacteria bacterium]|nr:hypothetical protein [Candidatus Gracilibacteria bacterium]
MTNRVLAIFIIIAIFSGLFGAYYYFFVANVGSLELNVGSFSGVSVELNGEFKNQYRLTCNKVCDFNKIPPINYTLNISKTGYKPQSKSIKIIRGEKSVLNINLQKLVFLKENNMNNTDKISLLRFNKSAAESNDKQVVIGVKDGIVYYYKFNPGFGIYSSVSGEEKNILLLGEKVISKVFFNKNDGLILINAEGESFVFDISSKINYSISIKDDFIYVKSSIEDNKLLLKTKDSTYIYDLKTNTGIKNTVFNDYIILGNDNVLGLISKKDRSKLSILNFNDNGKDKLILNNISTRDRKIVFETEFDVKYMELIDGKILLTLTDGKQFEVKELNY